MINLSTIMPRLVNYQVEFVIIGGVAATVHGSSYITNDLDICYSRHKANLEKLAACLKDLHPRLRGAPANIPFLWDAETIQRGLNFALSTDLGDIDLLGEVAGIGIYQQVSAGTICVELYGVKCAVISLEKLILAKRTAGRPKDLLAITELEAIRETDSQDPSDK